MIKTTPKNLLLFFVGIVVVGLLYWFVYWPISPFGIQLKNLQLADAHAMILRAKFSNDSRFSGVHFGKFTGRNGCLSVSGKVSSEDDIHFITNAVGMMGCPVGVDYNLFTSNGDCFFLWYDRGNEEPRSGKFDSTLNRWVEFK